MKIAIIGAGLSGLTAAHFLKDKAEITLFDKSRGVSGRMSTRRAEPYFFDHGAQFFTAESQDFKEFITPLIRLGKIKTWHARFVEFNGNEITQSRQWSEKHPHYVGAPHMNVIAKHLAENLNIQLNTRIASIIKSENGWQLFDDTKHNLGTFDWVICAIPPLQAKDILPTSLACYQQIKNTKMQSCFALMLGFKEPLDLNFDAALVRNKDISWISVNSSKPDRPEAFSLLVNSTNNWAEQHIDDNKDKVTEYLCQQVSDVIGYDVTDAQHKVVHAWHYANIEKQNKDTHILEKSHRIAICGDWLIQGRVEAAFKSGYDLAQNLIKHLSHQ